MTRPLQTLLVILALLAPVAAASTVDDERAVPAAVVVQPIVDLGRVSPAERFTAEFVIQNRGDAPLEIHEARASCACTVVEYDRTIAAGEEGRVIAELDTESIWGSTAKTIRLFTNDPSNAELALTLKADVRPVVSIFPGYVRFLVVWGQDGDRTNSQTLWAADGTDLEVVNVESPLPYVTVQFREARLEERQPDASGKQWRIETTLSPEAPVGPLFDHLVVHTNHPKQESLRLPLSGYVKPVLTVTPPAADFGEVEVTQPLKASLVVRNLSGVEIEMGEIENDLAALDAVVTTVRKGRTYNLHLTLTPEMPKGPFQGRVKIHTSSPQSPVLEVEVRGTIL